jgi:alpha,alpha-trehalose phosphorylase
MDRITRQGFQKLLAAQEQYMDDFWRRSDVRVKDVRLERIKRTTVEVQQAIRFNLFISYRRRRGPKMPACRRRA